MIKHVIDCPFLSFLKLASFFSQSKDNALLLSGDHVDEKPSYLCLFPYQSISITQTEVNPWDQLKEKISNFDGDSTPKWIGYLSYEMSSYSDKDRKFPHRSISIPLAHFSMPSVIFTYYRERLTICLVQEAKQYLDNKSLGWFEKFSSAHSCSSFIHSLPDIESPIPEMSPLSESDTFESYLDKIQKAKELIYAGDIYQVNISRNFLLKTKAKAFDLFYKLFQINPVPFSAYLNFESFQIISASPERFLRLSNGMLETRPIKGTVKRGSAADEDIALRSELINSPKENAELMMICDLMRNDLGKVSHTGSVKCLELKRVLEFSNVFHLESTIISKPLDYHPIELIKLCFPAGSITGCPKLRSMEIINEIEKRSRHIYCGSIGYISSNGNFDFNVAIRTALLKDQILEVQLGGAITADSNQEAEYNETLYKGNPFLKAFASVNISS